MLATVCQDKSSNAMKYIREGIKPGLATNPSKRHRERLNSELEIVAALLPYEQNVISRLDKLSVLRLAVSYLQIKTHFQACLHRYISNFPFAFAHSYPFIPTSDATISYGGGIPTAIHHCSGQSLIDPNEYDFESMALKALGGFILILNENGDIYYVSENIETYLGFHQSDILHQSLFEMIHSEDREDIRLQLAWNYNVPLHITCLQDILTPNGMPYLERNVNARFRCLLDNTCGFLRIDVRGKLMSLHGLPNSYVLNRIENHSSGNMVLGLVAVCSPFVPPNVADQQQMDDPILKTKHSLDFTLVSTDNQMKALLELDDKNLPYSFYNLVHVDDATCIAEAHKEVTKNSASGILIYRLISIRSQRVYWIQSSCRMFYKNGKPETIGLTHRLLTEVEGMMLFEKRTSLRAKLLSFDDSLLQSPSNLQSTAALPSTSCGDVTSLSLCMIGSEKNRCSTSKRQNAQFAAMPTRSKHSLSIPVNRNIPTQVSVRAAEVQQEQHLSIRGRKRKKQTSSISANQSSILSVPQYSTFMMPTTSNNLKETQMENEGQQQILVATTAAATQSENFATTATVICGVSGTNNPSMIPGLLQLPQDLTSFPGLTAYFSSDNTTGTTRHEQSYHWSSATKSNYWPSSSSSDLYYQNYMTNNAAISNGFYQSQMEQNNLIAARNRMEYPTFFTSNDLTFTGSTYTPTPAQLLLSSSELLQPSTAVQSTNTNSIFRSTVFDTSGHSTIDTFSAAISDYTQSMQMITGDNGGEVTNCSNTSGSTGFNLISEVTNTLLG
ncbi:aryl hydrocarbon receptor AHR-1, putative [Brugia malayi]|uniref:Aryl hydrocarbon receptor AHR-1, putative n=4 Tax=Brugia TaxID=6278 RepID=A0A4E9FLB6_BRUMA|nr:aryl hydrocarbon receptor AHR-1, putative [Brugia malayi]VIO97254.1 aryl hydrocarbon receptor AHR-1, putative [Brugia malayi]